MIDDPLPFSVQERDIDLLILEQLHVSPEFVGRLASRIGIEGASFASARHSVYRGNGETDVLVHLDAPDGRVAVMIEDKIGAVMQPEQCNRYHIRGQELCDRGEALRYTTVLCAPSSYLRSVPDTERWDHRLPIEDIEGWLSTDETPAALWRRRILRGAFSKATRARQADDKMDKAFDSQISPFKTAYREFVLANYPTLKASAQTGRDREYYLGAKGLPAGIRLKHAFFRGEVSLIFERRWADQTRSWLMGNAPSDAWLVENGGELHLRRSTEIIDPAIPVPDQAETVTQALDRIIELVAVAEQFVSTYASGLSRLPLCASG